jgi:hypothetical protein
MFTMRPYFASIMSGTTERVTLNNVVRFLAMCACHSSGEIDAKSVDPTFTPICVAPALMHVNPDDPNLTHLERSCTMLVSRGDA